MTMKRPSGAEGDQSLRSCGRMETGLFNHENLFHAPGTTPPRQPGVVCAPEHDVFHDVAWCSTSAPRPQLSRASAAGTPDAPDLDRSGAGAAGAKALFNNATILVAYGQIIVNIGVKTFTFPAWVPKEGNMVQKAFSPKISILIDGLSCKSSSVAHLYVLRPPVREKQPTDCWSSGAATTVSSATGTQFSS